MGWWCPNTNSPFPVCWSILGYPGPSAQLPFALHTAAPLAHGCGASSWGRDLNAALASEIGSTRCEIQCFMAEMTSFWSTHSYFKLLYVVVLWNHCFCSAVSTWVSQVHMLCVCMCVWPVQPPLWIAKCTPSALFENPFFVDVVSRCLAYIRSVQLVGS